MKILYLLQDLPWPPTDGVRIKVFCLLRQIATKCDCSVLSFADRDLVAREEQFRREIPQARLIKVLPSKRGVSLHLARLKTLLRGRPPFLARWRCDSFNRIMRQLIASERFDLAHLDALAMVSYLEECGSIPTVLSTTDAVSLALRRSADHASVCRRLYRLLNSRLTLRLERDLLGLADAVHVVSGVDAARIAKDCPQANVVAITQPVLKEVMDWNGTPRRLPGSSDGPLILILGRLGNFGIREGILRFIRDSWPTISSHLPDAQLLVVGSGADASLRMELARCRNVVLAGWVEDFAGVVASADVVVFPDITGTGIKTRALFTLALGRAMVASPLATEGIGLNSGEHFLRADSPGDFADAVCSILTNAELKCRLGNEARQFARRNLAEEAIAADWLRLYEAAMRRKKSERIRV